MNLQRNRRVERAATEAVALLLLGLAEFSPASAQTLSLGTDSRNLVYNAAAIKPMVDAAGSRRVDFMGIGDSNMAGWDHGYAKAWSDRYGWYASSLMGMNNNGGWGSPGYIDSGAAPYGAQATGAPAQLDKYRLWYSHLNDGYNNFPPSYAYYPDGTSGSTTNWQPTAILRQGSPLWGQDLTWNIRYGVFPTGGAFTPDITVNGDASRIPLLPRNRIYTDTGPYGLADAQVAIPASTFNAPNAQALNLAISPFNVAGHNVTGPFLGLWQRVTSNAPSGVSFTTMLWQGGGTALDAAKALQNQSDDAIREFIFNEVRYQNGTPMLLVHISQGGNDMGGTSASSVGPSPVPSWNPEGFADNVEAIIQRIRPIWITSGYDPTNLFFQTGTIHPLNGTFLPGKSRVQRLAEQEEAVIALSKENPEYNLAVIRGTRVSTPQTFTARNWYDALGEAHLNTNGYEGFSELVVRQVEAYTHPELESDRSVVTSLSFTFDHDLTTALSPEMLQLHNVTANSNVSSDDIAVQYDPATRTATWIFGGLPFGELQAGNYQATLTAPGENPVLFNFSATTVVGNWEGGNGNWSSPAHWAGRIVPTDPSLTIFLDRSSAGVTSNVTLDQDATFAAIVLNTDDSLTINAGKTLTLTTAGSALKGMVNNAGTINAPVLTFEGKVTNTGVLNAPTITFLDNLTNTSTIGTTSLAIGGNVTNSGSISTTSLAIQGGVANSGSISTNSLTIQGGVANFGAMITTSLVILGGVTNTGTIDTTSLTIEGGGNNSGAIDTSTLTIGGIVTNTGAINAPNLTIANAGELRYLNGNVQTTDLQLLGNAQMLVGPGGNKTLKLASLSINATGGAKIDLTDNKMIIANAQAGTWNGSGYTGITGLIASGRNDGTWSGSGITTSTPFANGTNEFEMLGVATAAEACKIAAGETALWHGQTVTGSDVLVLYTFGADANLSGTLDIDDYGQIDFNASTGSMLAGWYNGDFDYNGVLDADDYGIIDFVASLQGMLLPGPGNSTVELTSVPEPSAIGFLTLATGVIATRRRRRR